MSTQLNSLGENQFLAVKDINHPRQDLIIDAANLNNNSAPYKVYTALLTQKKNNPPTAIILENTIGDIVWTRNSKGEYVGTLNGAFTTNKVICFAGVNNGKLSSVQLIPTSVNEINLKTINLYSNFEDDLLSNTSIEIRVYN